MQLKSVLSACRCSRVLAVATAGLACLAGHSATAELKLPSFFADDMVLQQGMPVPVWGTTDPGAKVTVSFRGQTQNVVAAADGKWLVKLDTMPASAEPAELAVTADLKSQISNLKFQNVLVGEVWFCSGQSNMQFQLKGAKDAPAEIAAANYPLIRMFTGGSPVCATPQRDLPASFKPSWQRCSPQTAGEFSAVAYLFGREIHKTQKNVPVGLLHASCGWTPAEAWTPREAMLADPDLKCCVERWDAAIVKFQDWRQECDAAKAAGKPEPAQPKGSGDPAFIHRASGLYNGAVNPCMPFAIRGVIWYQGETNDNRGIQYRKLFPALITSWRRNWGQGDFPFLFVQLANVLPPPDPAKDPRWFDSEWSEVREAQNLTLDKVINTGMAVTIDIGEEKNVHPLNKQDVGLRLSAAARVLAYGERLPFSGPRFEKMTVENGKAKLSFKYLEGGLMTKDGKDPSWFYIAGPDQKFVNAQAKLDGDSILVWSDQVKEPAAVRYAWANNPLGSNLYNKAGFPASPFRTDDWPGKSTGSTKMFIDP